MILGSLPTSHQLQNIKYIKIFNYYDEPLFFIGRTANHSYLFLATSQDGAFLITPLNNRLTRLVMSDKPLREIMPGMIKAGKILIAQNANIYYLSIQKYIKQKHLTMHQLIPYDPEQKLN